MRNRVNLLGTLIDNVDLAAAMERIAAFAQSSTPHQVVTANIDFLRLGAGDAGFRQLMNTADLVVADGMPLIWASRLLDEPLPQRITGIELVDACARLAAAKGYGIFLLGAAPGVAEEAALTLQQRHPGLVIVGTYAPSPDQTPEQEAQLILQIRAAAPHMLFVALGAPRQDQWIDTYLQQLGVPVCMGVGGSFDMLAGRVKRAPGWMQQAGLEWLFRMMQEPGRLWRRYFLYDLPVFARLMIRCLRRGRGSVVPPAQEAPQLLDPEPSLSSPDLYRAENRDARAG